MIPMTSYPNTDPLEKFLYLELGHPKLNQVRETLLSTIQSRSCPPLIVITGSPGVGKTTLIHSIIRMLFKTYESEMASDPTYLPAYYFLVNEVEETIQGVDDFYEQQLNWICLQEFEKHCRYPDRTEKMLPASFFKLDGRRDKVAIFRPAWIKALRHRRTHYVFLDESALFFNVRDREEVQRRALALVGVAQDANIVFILIGNHDLLDRVLVSGPLSRRSKLIYFDRYHLDRADDERAYRKLIQAFSENLPFKKPTDLNEYFPILARDSIGCAGMLKDNLDWIVERCHKSGADQLLRQHIDLPAHLRRFAPEQVKRLHEQAYESEQRLGDYHNSFFAPSSAKSSAAIAAPPPPRSVKPGLVRRAGKPRKVGQVIS
jgi:hypothetical protein